MFWLLAFHLLMGKYILCLQQLLMKTKIQKLSCSIHRTVEAKELLSSGSIYVEKTKGDVIVTQSCVKLCDPWTVAHQAPLSLGFPRWEYWSGLSVPSPGDLPDPGVEPASPSLAGGPLTAETTRKAQMTTVGGVNAERLARGGLLLLELSSRIWNW